MHIILNGLPLLGQKTGIGHYTHHLGVAFAQRGHHVNVFMGSHWSTLSDPTPAGATPPATDLKSSTSPTVPRSTAWRIRVDWWVIRLQDRFKTLIKRLLPGSRAVMSRVMQFRFNQGPAAQVVFEPNFVALKTALPTVVTVHDLSWLHYPETHPAERVAFMHEFFPATVAAAARIITVSDFVRRELEVAFPVTRGKVVVIHNGVAHEGEHGFRPRSESETRDVLTRHGLTHGRYFVLLGTLEPRKNIAVAIAAHACLPPDQQRQWPLVLVGAAGWHTEGIDQALAPGLAAGTLRVLGYLPDGDCRDVVAGALGLIYPSFYEGFGLPPLEAMAAGVPVIAARASAVPEVVGDAGLLCDPTDIPAFADAMRTLLEDPERRAACIVAGLQRAAGFSWSRTADETLAVFSEVALAHPLPPGLRA